MTPRNPKITTVSGHSPASDSAEHRQTQGSAETPQVSDDELLSDWKSGRLVVTGCDADAPKRVTSKQVECPTCGALPGEPCRGSAYSGRSHRSVQSHWRRVEAAKEVSRGA